VRTARRDIHVRTTIRNWQIEQPAKIITGSEILAGGAWYISRSRKQDLAGAVRFTTIA
jgi:hypothetical protein